MSSCHDASESGMSEVGAIIHQAAEKLLECHCEERYLRRGNLEAIDFIKPQIAEFIPSYKRDCGVYPEALKARFFALLRMTEPKGLAMTSEELAQRRQGPHAKTAKRFLSSFKTKKAGHYI